jgi:hypothetical protein
MTFRLREKSRPGGPSRVSGISTMLLLPPVASISHPARPLSKTIICSAAYVAQRHHAGGLMEQKEPKQHTRGEAGESRPKTYRR